MSRTAAALTVLIVLVGSAVAFLWWQEDRGFDGQLPQAEEPAPIATPAVPSEPEIRYPLALEETPEEPLPALDESDATFRAALGDLIGAASFKSLFYPQSIVRRIVVTVDNLPREVVSDRLRPVKPAEGGFRVRVGTDQTTIAPENAARYTPYIRALEQVDPENFSKAYVRFYPLFQSAYRDLGYPKAYFNDRLVEVIDHMLAAPERDGPIALVQPHVFYQYADPALESSSAGHKLMLRMGRENAVRVKAKLREIRAVVSANATR